MGGGELAGSGGLKPEAGPEAALRRLAESDLIAVVTATMEGITEANGADRKQSPTREQQPATLGSLAARAAGDLPKLRRVA